CSGARVLGENAVGPQRPRGDQVRILRIVGARLERVPRQIVEARTARAQAPLARAAEPFELELTLSRHASFPWSRRASEWPVRLAGPVAPRSRRQVRQRGRTVDTRPSSQGPRPAVRTAYAIGTSWGLPPARVARPLTSSRGWVARENGSYRW